MEILLHPAALAAARAPHLVVDVRSTAAYAADHLPGAYHIADLQAALLAFDADEFTVQRPRFQAALAELGTSGAETLVFYDDGAPGFSLACRAFVAFAQLGYPRLALLEGGQRGWLAAGLPVTQTAPAPRSPGLPLLRAGDVIAGKRCVREALEREHSVLLDVREEDEWSGAVSSPIDPDYCPRRGRIPGARWLAAGRIVRPGAGGLRARPATEIRDECLNVGITPDTPVILYCFRGNRAAASLPLLKAAGIENVRVYFGSWDEWSRDPALPVETGPARPRAPLAVRRAA